VYWGHYYLHEGPVGFLSETSDGNGVGWWRAQTQKEASTNVVTYLSINTDLRLLTYIMDLLRRFNIESTGPRISCPTRGTIINDPERAGKKYSRNKDCTYDLHIRASSNMSFYRYIGFTITKKADAARKLRQEKHYYTYPSPNHFPTILKIITNIAGGGI
jgi:hypothetical protein